MSLLLQTWKEGVEWYDYINTIKITSQKENVLKGSYICGGGQVINLSVTIKIEIIEQIDVKDDKEPELYDYNKSKVVEKGKIKITYLKEKNKSEVLQIKILDYTICEGRFIFQVPYMENSLREFKYQITFSDFIVPGTKVPLSLFSVLNSIDIWSKKIYYGKGKCIFNQYTRKFESFYRKALSFQHYLDEFKYFKPNKWFSREI